MSAGPSVRSIALLTGAFAISVACSEPVETTVQNAPPAAAAEAKTGTAERLFADALVALELDRNPAEAVRLFEQVILHDDASRALRAKSLLGIARGKRLLGDHADAEAGLRRVQNEFGDLTDLAAEARGAQRSLVQGSARHTSGRIRIPAGKYFDLDVGGLFPSPTNDAGGAAELTSGPSGVQFLVRRREAVASAQALATEGDHRPWWRLKTDEGRTAWVQVLPGRDSPIVRYVTRTAGEGPLLGASGHPFAVGDGKGIAVWFTPDAAFARYRIERQTARGSLREVGVIDGPPYRDTAAEAGKRYRYRITGVTPEGDESAPASVQGTTRSNGIFEGVVELPAQSGPQHFDFLAQRLVGSGGDLVLTATYGGRSGAGFLDHFGNVVRGTTAAKEPLTSLWAPLPGRAHAQIPSGGQFIVPIAGGGAARCRIELAAAPNVVRVHYTVNPDGETFPPPPQVVIDENEQDSHIRFVDLPSGFEPGPVAVHDVPGGRIIEQLPVVDGVAVDGAAGPGTVRHYTVAARDRHGRASTPHSLTLNRRPAEATAGEFAFHYEQGFSFDHREVCDRSVADVTFDRCAGGITSITLGAPGGITNLESVTGRDRASPSAGRLLDAVLGADPAEIHLDPSARADSRQSESDVFVLRTRTGGWARLAIVERDDQAAGGWTKKRAHVRYAYNPREPVFGDVSRAKGTYGGLHLAAAAVSEYTERRAATPPTGAESFAGTGGGEMPSTERQEVLLAQAWAGDREMATYRFDLGRRDDPGYRDTGDDWDIVYGAVGDRLDAQPQRGVVATVVDLGEATWDDVTAETTSPAGPVATASFGHVYLWRRHDTDRVRSVLLRVTALEPSRRVAFEWIALDDELRLSPGLALGDGTRARLATLFTAGARGKAGRIGATDDALTPEGRRTLAVLRAPRNTKYVLAGPPIPSLRGLLERKGIVLVLAGDDDEAAQLRFRYEGEGASLAEILEHAFRQSGMTWEITAEGHVRVAVADDATTQDK